MESSVILVLVTIAGLVQASPLCVQGPFPNIVVDGSVPDLPENQYVVCPMRYIPLLFQCSPGLIFNWETLTCDYPPATRGHSQGPVWYPYPPHTKPGPESDVPPKAPAVRVKGQAGTVVPVLRPDDAPIPRPYPADTFVPILKPEDGPVPRPYPVDMTPILTPAQADEPVPRPYPKEPVTFPVLTPNRIPRPHPIVRIFGELEIM